MRTALRHAPENPHFHNELGVLCQQLGQAEDAASAYRRAIEIQPDFSYAYNNLGNLLREQNRLTEAVMAYEAALELEPSGAGHNNLANALRELGRVPEAVAHYRQAIGIDPGFAVAWTNLGVALTDLGRLPEARDALKKALELKPEYAAAWNNFGHLMKSADEFDKAAEAYRKALDYRPDLAEVHYNLGTILALRNDPESAMASYRQALELAPDYAPACFELLQELEKVCAWQDAAPLLERCRLLTDQALAGKQKLFEPPFSSLMRTMDPERNSSVARLRSLEISRKVESLRPSTREGRPIPIDRRMRIGYLSCDLYDHPTAHLMLGLFRLHDRQNFSVHVYSYGPDDRSRYRRSIERDSEHFIEIGELDIEEAARVIRNDEIDLLIDLKGHTRNNRLEICALRPAPIQLTYLGFPGTSGADFFDYMLADPVVVPEEHATYYTEHIVYLPHCYQVNDHGQRIDPNPPRRADHGLDENAFVFCNFNETRKIDTLIFRTWMRILRRSPGSLLWLYRSNTTAPRHLRREAERQGVDPGR
ncbi:MAG: tetratricopeptide repeat protein, partial [Verrucomicrobiota bacterium]